ncbi:MAG: 2-(1,2-epoxy-1,2-dihydrophenyl)acetyl-CoA isomerase [Flavobacteriales bacterium]|nr:2-(1,2-epoxy-1,2-dihydrophenyl)acetyl-CoA isomerase [Flavobacteriales bacterium]|tara:strand:+ start:8603 stop:9373 length:771 start_codon:yes stop_codon:yes gene_type:complete
MIKLDILDGVGKITLNRPEKYHSFIRQMALQLQSTLDQCNENKQVRAILITATGKAFCAGQDLAEAIDPSIGSISKIIQEHYNPIIRRIRDIEKPIIAAVNGVAAGAGASVALACDIVVATESASFVQAFSKIGLIPDSGSTFFLPRLIGMQKAAALMMTGEPISAKNAEKMGMIYKVYSDEDFEKESWDLASKLAKMPTKGLGLTKRLLNASNTNTLEDQLNMEDKYQVLAAKTTDFKEGVQSFLEKRKANFKGE